MKYVALLRGIGPGNPNMHGAKLKEFFENLGFKDVIPAISSGNVVFENKSEDVKKIEDKIEKELPKQLGFTSTTIIVSQEFLEKLVKSNPFKGLEAERSSDTNITFLKNPTKFEFKFPYKPDGKNYKLLSNFEDRAVASLMLPSGDRGPDLMIFLEKTFTKEITTRTCKTAGRILKAMEK